MNMAVPKVFASAMTRGPKNRRREPRWMVMQSRYSLPAKLAHHHALGVEHACSLDRSRAAGRQTIARPLSDGGVRCRQRRSVVKFSVVPRSRKLDTARVRAAVLGRDEQPKSFLLPRLHPNLSDHVWAAAGIPQDLSRRVLESLRVTASHDDLINEIDCHPLTVRRWRAPSPPSNAGRRSSVRDGEPSD